MTTPKLSHQILDPHNPQDLDGIARMYSRQPGGNPEVPSITTIISVLNSRMEWWRGRCAGKEAVKQAELIVQRKNETPEYMWKSKEKEIVTWIDEAAVRDMNVASQRGDVVHDYAEKVCRQMIGEDFDIAEEREKAMENLNLIHSKAGYSNEYNNGYFEAVHQFIHDFKIKPVTAEATVWNSTVGYAGTNDLLAYVDGRLTLLDWKTKKGIKDTSLPWYKPSIKPTIALQLEAAKHGEEMYSEVTGEWQEWKGSEAIDQIGVALAPNGYEAIRVVQVPETWETFKALRIAWEWDFNNLMGTLMKIDTTPLKPLA